MRLQQLTGLERDKVRAEYDELMKKIAELVLSMPGKKIVVLSALSGTTNALVRIGDHLLAQQHTGAQNEIAELEKHYLQFSKDLYSSDAYHAIGQEIVSRYFSLFRLLAAGKFDDRSYRELLAQGELISWLKILSQLS